MSHDTSNQSFCNKASNNIYNVHVNNIQSKANNSILNPIGNDVGQQHGSMKNNNVIMSMSQNDKFQLVNIIIISHSFLSLSHPSSLYLCLLNLYYKICA